MELGIGLPATIPGTDGKSQKLEGRAATRTDELPATLAPARRRSRYVLPGGHHACMASADAAAAGSMVRMARSLYRRWERMPPSQRDRLEPLAASVKARALELRGRTDIDAAVQELADENRRLADGLDAGVRRAA
jgi:hypothetical protein